MGPVHQATVDVYSREAARWAAARPARHLERALALRSRCVAGLPRIDLGCGHGPYLAELGRPVVALDAARPLLDIARRENPHALAVVGDLGRLPFRRASLVGGWARNSYLHLAHEALPLALADLHAALVPGSPLTMSMHSREHATATPDEFPGRFFALWEQPALSEVVAGAGFDLHSVSAEGDVLWVEAERARTIPDFVGAGMRVLVCGLNPSLVSADAGFGYAGPTNRFWPAALASGLLRVPRQPVLGLARDGVGMTDLVKRATANAASITPEEYRAGAQRVGRLVGRLRPGLVLFVGLSGWRAAVDRRARAGLQPERFAGAPAYVMPSTSGLNAHARMEDLVDHMRRALASVPAPPPAGRT